MKNKRTLTLTLFAAVALAIFLGPPVAQAQKELSVLTWNISYFKDGFQQWVDEFNKIHPDITIKRFDKKGSEWSTYYQTQVIAGTIAVSFAMTVPAAVFVLVFGNFGTPLMT